MMIFEVSTRCTVQWKIPSVFVPLNGHECGSDMFVRFSETPSARVDLRG